MIEATIERRSRRDGGMAARRDGERERTGGPYASPDCAEAEERAACRRRLGRGPDSVAAIRPRGADA